MNTQLLEALCKDFAAIYQCELIQDTIDIVRFDKGTPIDMAIQTLDLYTLHSFSKMIPVSYTHLTLPTILRV